MFSLINTLLLVATHLSNLVVKEFSVEIFEWSGTSWEPYVADDVQVQFYMMSPYVLKTLSTNGKVLLNFLMAILLYSSLINSAKFTRLCNLFQGRYFTSFKVPDVYGVFQFKVEYEKLGYTSLSLSKQVIAGPLMIFSIFLSAILPKLPLSASFRFTCVSIYKNFTNTVTPASLCLRISLSNVMT